MGWFIGWIEQGARKIAFAYFIQDDKLEDSYPSIRAKAAAKERLLELIETRLK
jgi:beta-lactamase class D